LVAPLVMVFTSARADCRPLVASVAENATCPRVLPGA